MAIKTVEEAKHVLEIARSVIAASILRPRNTGDEEAIFPTPTARVAAETVASVDIDDIDANELLEALAE